MDHLEPFLDHTLAHLEARLPDRIALANEAAVDFELEEPQDYLAGGGETSAVLRYPSIEVAATDWRFGRPTIGQVHWPGTAVVMTRAWLQDPNFGDLYRKTLRYGRCLVECLTMENAFGPHSQVQEMRGAYRVNPETNERQEFVGAALVIVQIETDEIRP